MSHDYSEYAQAVTDTSAEADSALAQLQRLADQQADQARVVADLEAQLTRAKEALRVTSENLLPEALDRVGIAEFKTSSGLVVSLKEQVRCGITEERAPKAYEWLREHGRGAIIKRRIALDFGTGEEERVTKLVQLLEQHEFADFDDKQSVNPQTLGAFVRNALAEGLDIPLDLFGVFRQRVAVLGVDKESKPKVVRGKARR